jgi:hypothetical protein
MSSQISDSRFGTVWQIDGKVCGLQFMCAGAARNMVKCCWAGCTVNYLQCRGCEPLLLWVNPMCSGRGCRGSTTWVSLGYVCVISDDYLAEVSSRQFIFSLTHFLVYVWLVWYTMWCMSPREAYMLTYINNYHTNSSFTGYSPAFLSASVKSDIQHSKKK